jgi:hypothetical protein
MTGLTCTIAVPGHDPVTTLAMDAGQEVVFTATPGGGSDYHYQWKKDGANVGTDSATYSYTAVVGVSSILCHLSGTGGDDVDSDACVVTVAAALSMATIPSLIANLVVGETIHLVGVVTGGTGSFSYLWQTCDDAAGTNPQSTGTTTIAKDYTPGAGTFYIRIKCTDSADTPVTVYSACITVTVKTLYDAVFGLTGYQAKIAHNLGS